jgi:beta-glucosidase
MSHAYQDKRLSIEIRVNNLLSLLSIEEKIGQLCKIGAFRRGESYHRDGDSIILDDTFKHRMTTVKPGSLYGLLRSDWWTERGWGTAIEPKMMAECTNMVQKFAMENSRWKIPMFFMEEAPHGLMALGCTVLPTGLGMGATWNIDLIRAAWKVIGSEAAAAGIHSCFGPVLEIIHDPRWSRVEEDFSEDPWLTAKLGEAGVIGLQDDVFPFKGRPFATLKHFAAHGDPEGGHNQAPAHLGPIEFRNIQLRPFEFCVKAGAKALMSAYNTIDGIPCAANKTLLTDILRSEWKFDGIVMADGAGLCLLQQQRFGADEAEISALAIKAGLDNSSVGCCSFYAKGLREALDRGLIDMADLDEAVHRTLSLKFRIGLFDNPYRKTGEPALVCGSSDHRAVSLEVARQSLTLLANPNHVLPLKNAKSIAVIGPNANTPMNQLGDYTAPQKRNEVVTVLDGMKILGDKYDVKVRYAQGCKIRSLRHDMFEEAILAAKTSDAIILVLGGSSAANSETGFLENGAAEITENIENSEYDKESGEGYDRAKLRLGGVQLELLDRLKELGKPIITVLIMGRPLIIDEVVALSDAVLLAWYPGMMGGQAVAEAIFGKYNPGGKLPVSFPHDEGQLPVYYNSQLPRNNYIDLESKPSFSFGYGLSYTTFSYSEPIADKTVIHIGEQIRVSIKVKNTGTMAGDEIIQLYLTDNICSIARPYRELRGFHRIYLQPSEEQAVEFILGNNELGFYNQEQIFVVEPGTFTVGIGGSLDSLKEITIAVK